MGQCSVIFAAKNVHLFILIFYASGYQGMSGVMCYVSASYFVLRKRGGLNLILYCKRAFQVSFYKDQQEFIHKQKHLTIAVCFRLDAGPYGSPCFRCDSHILQFCTVHEVLCSERGAPD
jgi:hypothetical protein